jgi:hypothetical protein
LIRAWRLPAESGQPADPREIVEGSDALNPEVGAGGGAGGLVAAGFVRFGFVAGTLGFFVGG